ncbi:MAG: class I SAM-dependent methyltransferase [Actinobacteria bacterium]|nr:class I SAM-dependent methyltransferase [Actinomycetota bacterium]
MGSVDRLLRRPSPDAFGEFVAAFPTLVDVLDARPGARVLVVACGQGASALDLARMFPQARVDGLDPDDGAIAAARREAARVGVDDRVRFEVADRPLLLSTSDYDVVICCPDGTVRSAVIGLVHEPQPLE